MKKSLTIIILLLTPVLVFSERAQLRELWFQLTRPSVPAAITLSDIQETKPEEVETFVIPDEFNLDMQFYPQAPFANWDMPYQEACEEASVLIAANYIRGREVSRAEFDKELLEIVDFENKYFGSFEHTDVEQTKEIFEKHYNYRSVEIIDNPTIDDIKEQIARGNPVLVPLAGRLIGNPYYTPPGPVYHFLVIKGYTKTHFITHDVGTKRGEDYTYPFEKLMNNIHDWEEPITSGEKKVLVIHP